MIVAPKGNPSLYRYDLGHPPVTSENLNIARKELAGKMEKRLRAYVETGIVSLQAGHLGLPKELQAGKVLSTQQ